MPAGHRILPAKAPRFLQVVVRSRQTVLQAVLISGQVGIGPIGMRGDQSIDDLVGRLLALGHAPGAGRLAKILWFVPVNPGQGHGRIPLAGVVRQGSFETRTHLAGLARECALAGLAIKGLSLHGHGSRSSSDLS